jgi:hypothetical protein
MPTKPPESKIAQLISLQDQQVAAGLEWYRGMPDSVIHRLIDLIGDYLDSPNDIKQLVGRLTHVGLCHLILTYHQNQEQP